MAMLFRGYNKIKGFVHGVGFSMNLSRLTNKYAHIIVNDYLRSIVVRESITRFAGVYDANKMPVYIGDTVTNDAFTGKVYFSHVTGSVTVRSDDGDVSAFNNTFRIIKRFGDENKKI